MTAFQRVAAEIEAAKQRIYREHEHHYVTCPDLVRCELGALQALFRGEDDVKKKPKKY